MKKFSLFVILSINFLVLPAHAAEEKVVIDRLTKSEAEELEIEIPDDVPPGFHTVNIEVYDDNGTVSQKKIEFCKSKSGKVDWDNKCPDLDLDSMHNSASVKSETSTPLKTGLKPYDPLSDSRTTSGIHIAAFAVLAALTSVRRTEKQVDENLEQESLQSVTSGDLNLYGSNPGKGDLSGTWNNKFTPRTDNMFLSVAHHFNKFSPLLTRTIQDGNTIRAIIGSWASILIPIGLLLGVLAAFNTQAQSLPPEWIIIGAIMTVAIFDAFAGLAAWLVYFVSILMSGNISNRPELLTTIGVAVLFFAPSLLASSFRPFRRMVLSGDDLWERATDYAVGTLLTYWVITKMVASMNGLSRLELPISSSAEELGLWAAALIIIRIKLEDLAVAQYPMRLRFLHVEIRGQSGAKKVFSLSLKLLFFIILAAPFVGSMSHLIFGSLLFILPQITSMKVEKKFPKKKFKLPKGVLKIVMLTFIMALASNLLEHYFPSSKDFIKWSFVLMAIPGFILHYLEVFSNTSSGNWRVTKNGRITYRIGGLVVFILMVFIVIGVDIASWVS